MSLVVWGHVELEWGAMELCADDVSILIGVTVARAKLLSAA